MRSLPWLFLAVASLLAADAVQAQGAEGDPEPTLTLSGTLYAGGVPVEGFVRLTQYAASYRLVHSAESNAGADGRFELPAVAGLATTNLAVHRGADYTQASIRLRGDLDFDWPVDGASLGDAPVRFAVNGPAEPDILVMDALRPGLYHCVMHPGETEAATGPPPISGAPPSSTPAPAPRDCPLTWISSGVAEGRLPRGLLAFTARDPDWAMCNWTLGHPDACQPYVPFEGSAPVPESGANVSIDLQRARPADTRLEGYYLSEVTGQPLARKPLFLTDGEARIVVTTDDDGSFRVGLPAGRYMVSATLCAHDPLEETIDLGAGAPLRQDFVQRRDSQPDSFSSGSISASRSGPAPSYPSCDGTPTPTMAGTPASEEPPEEAPVALSPSTGPAAPDDPGQPAKPELVEGRLVLRFEGLGPIGGATATNGNEADEVLKPTDRGSPMALWAPLGGLAARRSRLSGAASGRDEVQGETRAIDVERHQDDVAVEGLAVLAPPSDRHVGRHAVVHRRLVGGDEGLLACRRDEGRRERGVDGGPSLGGRIAQGLREALVAGLVVVVEVQVDSLA